VGVEGMYLEEFNMCCCRMACRIIITSTSEDTMNKNSTNEIKLKGF
jgi:hypothetical protein